MKRASANQLTPVQQAIIASVQARPGQFTRSELAKLLVGSHSSRTAALQSLPDYGRLSGHGRKAITFEIDILIQQGFLVLDSHGKLEPSPTPPTGEPPQAEGSI